MGMMLLSLVIAAAVGYLMGSINSAIITVRLLKHEDIRQFGSGNAGLTNTLRCFGKLCALLTLIGDLAKGVIAVLVSQLICSLLTDPTGDLYLVGGIAGIFAIIGHVFPLYNGFRGGKGVLVGVSIFLVMDWRVFCILIGIFALVLILSRYVSLASIIASCCGPFVTFLAQYFWKDLHGQEFAMWQYFLHAGVTAVMAIMVIIMHRENIRRLLSGTERKFGEKKAQ